MLKSTFSALQRRRWQYGFIFIHPAVITYKSRNYPKIRTYSSFVFWCKSKAH